MKHIVIIELEQEQENQASIVYPEIPDGFTFKEILDKYEIGYEITARLQKEGIGLDLVHLYLDTTDEDLIKKLEKELEELLIKSGLEEEMYKLDEDLKRIIESEDD